jgi:hypothetical protein
LEKLEVWYMIKEKNGRILDKDFEDGITGRAGEMQRDAQGGITQAQDYMYKKNDDFTAMVNEHPKSFVLGAFIGGVALGTLLGKGNR